MLESKIHIEWFDKNVKYSKECAEKTSWKCVKGVLGKTVNALESKHINNFEKTVHFMVHLIMNGYRDAAIFLFHFLKYRPISW